MIAKTNSRPMPGDRSGIFPPENVIFGRSPAMQAIRQKIEKIAASGVPILILGDNGTGKGLLAGFIHNFSSLPDFPFIKVNCAAIPAALLESELFGYEKGAFTGAHAMKPGRVELADRGTLFLDGIDEIDMSLQAKLLQLLQDGQFNRIGGQEDRKVQIRVICATNRDLENEIRAGRFRQDLFYRINVVSIEMPKLRERVEDIRDLVAYFLQSHSVRHKVAVKQLSQAVMILLEKHPWPGNIRQLENVIQQSVLMSNGPELLWPHLPKPIQDYIESGRINSPAPKDSLLQSREEVERSAIQKALLNCGYTRARAASVLGISRVTLYKKMKKYGLMAASGERAEAV